MRGNEGRWLAPSATPWDDAGERSLGPAETLVMACHRDLHGYRHAGASPGGEADLLDARVRDACPRRGSREAEGNGRDRNDIRRWRCRSRERPLGVATGTISGSHRMPAADRAGSPPETSSREGLEGIARSNRRSETTPPAGPPGRSPCRPGHGAASRRPATRGPTKGATRSRARTSDARRTGRSHAGRRGARSASPSAATGGAGRTPRASARGSQASPGRGRRMRAISRGAPTRHATWRGATRCSSGSPG